MFLFLLCELECFIDLQQSISMGVLFQFPINFDSGIYIHI